MNLEAVSTANQMEKKQNQMCDLAQVNFGISASVLVDFASSVCFKIICS